MCGNHLIAILCESRKIKPGNGKSYREFVDQNLHLPNLGMTNSSPWEMAHRSRWFTGLPIKNWWIFHGKLLVITRGYNLFSIAMIDYPRVNPSWDGFAKEHHGKGLVSQWGRYKICGEVTNRPSTVKVYPKMSGELGVAPHVLSSGKHTNNYGKSPCSMGKSTISMAMFNSYFDITRVYPTNKKD